MSDNIYADFGVTDAVISEPSEGYNEQMISQPVSVRDGDDAIVFEEASSEESSEETTDENQEESEEGAETEQSEEQGESEGETEEAPFEAVGDVPAELTDISNRVAEGESAFNDMVADAVSRGLEQSQFEAIAAEYADKGEFSPKSYETLAKIGYTKAFIDSFVAGQEAIGQQYVNSIVDYAGGQDKFNAIFAHLQANSPESVEALTRAIDARDLTSVKSIINLAAGGVKKTFGVKEQRTLTARAKQAAPAKAETQPHFESKADMIKAMNDKRYGRDDAYTREVEQKVWHSKF
ncbi:MAG: hypothetical protein EOM68_00095 [Spirochaetia bacterium]|nr:hypothetical protein [Spirochaetia bacterium]